MLYCLLGEKIKPNDIVIMRNYAISANTSVSSPALENTNWREQKSYSRDYQLTDDLSICVSILDDSSGYAVYDTYDGQRIGTLLLPNDQMSVDNLELKIADANSDGKNDVGVVSHNNNIICFNFFT